MTPYHARRSRGLGRAVIGLGRRRGRAACFLALAAALALSSAGSARAAEAKPPVVATDRGLVQGFETAGVTEFLGIPYAAPPVGTLRWRPPVAASPWQGVFKATAFGNTCPQGGPGVFAAPSVTEDCLYLNVFAPKRDRHILVRRPVMVWFYGGGLIGGESNDYDGSKLARQGDVVVVTFNYRVGALGFLSHPALVAEGHAASNYGIMDQQFALRWVKRNIAKFGGDPGNVTIFGQSGGATSVMANLVSPTAAGLFRRAINQSGTHIDPIPMATAVTEAKAFAAATGCADQSTACLRALPVAQILAHQRAIAATEAADFPVLDGTVIPRAPVDAFASGQFNRVPILTGLVADEQAFFLPEAMGRGGAATPADVTAYIASFGTANTAALLAKYPAGAYASPSLAEIAVAQGFKVCTVRMLNRFWVRFVPVYAYQFDDRTAPSYFPPFSYPMRAYHTAELQYLFPLFHGGRGTPHPLNAAQARLSDEIVRYWTDFARTGNPNIGPRPHAAAWPRYDVVRDDVQSLDIPASAVAHAYGGRYDCALWDRVLGYRP
jgi:para-nitrobenzyl esterase